MAILGGAVLLAKKALIVAAVSLIASSVTASKKKATSNTHTGDYYQGRRTASHIALNTGIPERYDTHIEPLSHTALWPTPQDYNEQYYPNFVHNHERFYADDINENSPAKPHSQASSRYRNGYNKDAKSEWFGLTQPENVS
jgi:hypothetical protein